MTFKNLILAALPALAAAQAGLGANDPLLRSFNLNNNRPLDYMYYFVLALLVLFTQLGFVNLISGGSQAKNVQASALHYILAMFTATLMWFSTGFALYYGNHANEAGSITAMEGGDAQNPIDSQNQATDPLWGGVAFWFLNDALKYSAADKTWAIDSKTLAMFFESLTGLLIAVAIAIGGFHEKAKGLAVIVYTVVLSGLALPVVFHSTQLQGWVFYFMQFDTLVVDFAGGSYLFWAGGVACLWSAIIAGPRRGRFDQEVDQDQFFPQECFRSIQGSLFLLIGFLAVNSIAYGNNSVEQLALITVNTVLGAMAGGFVSFILATMSHGHENGMVDLVKWFFHSCCCTGHPGPKVMKHGVQVDFVRTTNGMLAGLACVAAGCGNVVPFVAAIVGALGAFIYHVTSSVLKCFKIDDPLDFYAIFGATGFWGVIFAVLFDMAEGFSHFNGFKTYEIQGPAANNPDPNKANVGNALLVNLVSLLFIGLWMGTFSIITTAALKFFGQLRLEEDEEDLGFDAHHDFDSVFKEGKGPKAEEA